MKRSILAFLAVCLIAGGNLYAQKAKVFKGQITYTISYDGSWDAATLAQQPKETIVKVLGQKSRTEILTAGANIYQITLGADSTQIILLDISSMGLKYYIKVTKDKVLAEQDPDNMPQINYLEETKVIAGYTCKKAEYITKDEFGDPITTIVYYCTEIGGAEMNFGGQFSGLAGFPMEYSNTTDEGTVTYSVTEVKTKKVKISDKDFMIPVDYLELDEEAAKQLFGE